MSPRTRIFAAALLVCALAAAALALIPRADPPLRPLDPQAQPNEAARQVSQLLLREQAELDLAPRPEGRAYVALRREGLRLKETWATGADWRQALVSAVAKASAEISPDRQGPDSVEVCLPYARRGLRLRAKRDPLSNVHRGIRGMRIRLGEHEQWTCPTEMIADNRDFGKVQQRFQRARGVSAARLVQDGQAEQFDAHQLLISLPAGEAASVPAQGRLTRMHRGNTVVPMSAVTRSSIEALTGGMAAWMTRHVQEDGRMTYLYWPSRGEEPRHRNNMIRQFMASLALVRLANQREDPAIEKLASQNLRYNFTHFYREESGLGLITFRRKSKLGAAALAALAVAEAPFRAELASYEAALIALTDHMQQPDGSFRTFYGTERNDNQNFYPGETLLLWATLLQQAPDDARLKRFMQAFRYYRRWHREHTNPAFIPWHTQAYYKVWRLTRDRELAEFIFEMNDFLAGFQEWEESRYPDTRGRFYDDDRRQFGPPHASSTGVYLEGLIDAYELAQALQDEARAARYRTTILRGLRSLMQLQYQDEVDMYYIAKRDQVLGGLRTTVYDNTIRVDNIQHSLMALLKIVPAFERDGTFERLPLTASADAF